MKSVAQLIEMQEAVWAGELPPETLKAAIKEIINSSDADIVALIGGLCRASPTMSEHDVADMMEAELNKPLLN